MKSSARVADDGQAVGGRATDGEVLARHAARQIRDQHEVASPRRQGHRPPTTRDARRRSQRHPRRRSSCRAPTYVGGSPSTGRADRLRCRRRTARAASSPARQQAVRRTKRRTTTAPAANASIQGHANSIMRSSIQARASRRSGPVVDRSTSSRVTHAHRGCGRASDSTRPCVVGEAHGGGGSSARSLRKSPGASDAAKRRARPKAEQGDAAHEDLNSRVASVMSEQIGRDVRASPSSSRSAWRTTLRRRRRTTMDRRRRRSRRAGAASPTSRERGGRNDRLRHVDAAQLASGSGAIVVAVGMPAGMTWTARREDGICGRSAGAFGLGGRGQLARWCVVQRCPSRRSSRTPAATLAGVRGVRQPARRTPPRSSAATSSQCGSRRSPPRLRHSVSSRSRRGEARACSSASAGCRSAARGMPRVPSLTRYASDDGSVASSASYEHAHATRQRREARQLAETSSSGRRSR